MDIQIEPIEGEEAPFGLLVAHTLATVRQGRVPIRCINLSGTSLHLLPRQDTARVCITPEDLTRADAIELEPVDGEPWTLEVSLHGLEVKSQGLLEQMEANLTEFSAEQVKQIEQFLQRYQWVFTRDIQHETPKGNTAPIWEKYQQIPPQMYQEVKELLAHMLQNGSMSKSRTVGALMSMLGHEELETHNVTFLDGFILLGITDAPDLQIFLFIFFLMFYLFNLSGNLSIVLLIIIEQSLYKPMYFFLGNLSFLDIFYSTTTVPKMLSGLLLGDKRISVFGCIAQLYFFHFLGSTEALLLSSMSYDRYVAICNPLRYHVLMGRTSCIQLASSCWLIGFLYSLLLTIITFRLPYCNKKQVTHFYCDIKPVIKLACANTKQIELLLSGIFALVAVSTFLLITVSYMYIGSHILKIRTRQARRKAFFTCTSHITVVLLYFGTNLGIYLGSTTQNSLEKDRMSAILITVIIPAVNPLIYTLRNKEVKKSFQRLLGRKQHCVKCY
ncbi:olfactory receptor 12D1-like [Phyllobates terribilis]|uniref:olfactory receptor 12D1-like n=1 Tax=Phyllobates terribilis TaxID=111132 RepID=UPI003CCB1A30